MSEIFKGYAEYYKDESSQDLRLFSDSLQNVQSSFLDWVFASNAHDKIILKQKMLATQNPFSFFSHRLKNTINDVLDFIQPDERSTEEEKNIAQSLGEHIQKIRDKANKEQGDVMATIQSAATSKFSKE